MTPKGSRAVATGGAFRTAGRGTRGKGSLLLYSPQRGDGLLIFDTYLQRVTRIRARSPGAPGTGQAHIRFESSPRWGLGF